MVNPLTIALLIAVGVLAIAGGTLEWSVFMRNRRVRVFIELFGRDGARAFYVGIGMTMIMAVMAMT